MNILFNRETLQVVGLGRNPLPFELEIKNVDTTNLTKVITEPVQEIEKDELDNELFLLPIITEQETGQIRVETTEVTDEPAMLKKIRKVRLIEDGEQVYYFPIIIDEETGDEIVGQPVPCYTNEESEVQKVDDEGIPLYYTYVPQFSEITTYEKITSDDERWNDDLKQSLVDKEVPKTISFEDHMSEFNYNDIVDCKEKQLTYGTLYTEALLFELMEEDLFSTHLESFNANLGLDFISIPAGGQVRTEKLLLTQSHDVLAVKAETNVDGLEIYVGELASDLQPIDRFNERHFSSPVSAMYVLFKNTSDKTIDLNSFAVMG